MGAQKRALLWWVSGWWAACEGCAQPQGARGRARGQERGEGKPGDRPGCGSSFGWADCSQSPNLIVFSLERKREGNSGGVGGRVRRETC